MLGSRLGQLYHRLPLDVDIESLVIRAEELQSRERPQRHELKSWLLDVSAKLKSYYFIIDGLDECSHFPEKQFEDLCGCVFVTNTPAITPKPQTRDGLCGAVLLRCRDARAEETEANVLNSGEVCGMVRFADLIGDSYEPLVAHFLFNADSFDMLMEEGWTIPQS